MKPKTTQSEPPAVAGGLVHGTTEHTFQDAGLNTTQVQSPATAGGTDLATENADLKAAIRLRDSRDAVTAELKAAGARSPELLFENVRDSIEFDADGKPQNVAAVVSALKAKYPEQFGTQTPQSIDGGAGQTATPRLTKETLRKMKPSEIAELDWAEVRRVLAN